MRLALLLAFFACAPKVTPTATEPTAEAVSSVERAAAIVASPDRDPADVALDAGRHPAELLTTFDVRPGMQVADLMSGGGYTAELLARAVGETGRVYGVNSPFILERFAAAPWAERLAKPVNAPIQRLDRAFDAPFPPEVVGLDRVFSVLVYHDFVWMNVDRAAMNRAIFEALAPDGLYIVIDHASAPGRGWSDVETLHRVEEQVVVAEIEAAGFELVGRYDTWRRSDDTKDWSTSPRTAGERRGTSDRFALAFRKAE